MGGQGSGRLNKTDQFLRDQAVQVPQNTPPVNNNIVLPNLSGVKEEALKTSDTDITGGAGSDVKVAIDSGATAGYLGAASSDGVLRTGSPLTYTDGGDYVTLDVDESAITITESQISDLGSYITASSTDTLTNKTINDFTNDVHADDVHKEVRNESGGAMAIGDAVYASGYSVGQSKTLVSFADSTAASTMPAIGIVNESIANNADGEVIEIGKVVGFDTSSWSVGDQLYVSETGTTGNTLTSTKPTGSALIEPVAIVLRSHASLGEIEVSGSGHYETNPNLANTKLWIGDASGVPQEFTLSGDVSMTAGGVVTLTTDNIVNADINSAAAIDISKTALVAGTNITLSTNTLNVDDAFLKNDASDTTTGTITAAGFEAGSGDINTTGTITTGDHGTAATDEVVNVCYGTGSPPTANTTTIGSLFIKYTA